MEDKLSPQNHPDVGSILSTERPKDGIQSKFELLNHHLEQFDSYMVCRVMAEKLKEDSLLNPVIFVVGGLSGTGKSTLARSLADSFGAVHVQADAVRKHLHSVPVNERGSNDLYTPEKSRATYRGMIERVGHLVHTGVPVVLDGTYMAPYQRIGIEKLSVEAQVPIEGLWLKTSLRNQENRVSARVDSVSDAGVEIVRNMYQSHHNLPPYGWRLIDASPTAKEVQQEAEKIVQRYLKK
jgi:predicted kinase